MFWLCHLSDLILCNSPLTLSASSTLAFLLMDHISLSSLYWLFSPSIILPSDTHMVPLPPLSSLCLNVSFSMIPIVTFLPNVANTSDLDAPTHPFPLTLLSFFIWIYLSVLTHYLIHLPVTFFCYCLSSVQSHKGRDFFSFFLSTNGSQGPRILAGKKKIINICEMTAWINFE